jgi:hypothetical protein
LVQCQPRQSAEVGLAHLVEALERRRHDLAQLCVPRTSSGVLKVRPGNIGDEGHQEQGEM